MIYFYSFIYVLLTQGNNLTGSLGNIQAFLIFLRLKYKNATLSNPKAHPP